MAGSVEMTSELSILQPQRFGDGLAQRDRPKRDRVEVAADITEARALWQADSYSLILVDVHNDAVNVQERKVSWS